MPTRRHGWTHWGTELDSQRPGTNNEISSVLSGAVSLLNAAGVPNPDADAALLLAHAWGLDSTGLSRKRLFAEAVPGSVLNLFAGLIDQRCRRIPLQHLTGSVTFRYLDLSVGPGVFIPRPETELLVTEVLDELERRSDSAATSRTEPALVVDLCSGSGAIALSLAFEHPRLRVIGVEREAAALEWALKNRSAIDVGDSDLEFLAGDAGVFATEHPELHGRVDVVVSNPPYVPDGAIPRDPEVRDHDPAAALYGGSTGLEIPARIVSQAEMLLRPGGFFIMEHAEEQGAGVRALIASTASLRRATTFPDYTGRDRYTVAHRADARK